MSAADDAIAEALADIPNIDFSIIGIFVDYSGSLATVDVGASRVTIPNIGTYFPVPGDAVRLIRVDKQTFLWGPAVARSAIGRVTVTGSPRCTVEYPAGSGVTKLMGYPSNITPAVGDVVLIDWTSGGTIIDKITAAPVIVTPGNPAPPVAPQEHRETFTAIDSGTFNYPSGKWSTNEVWAVTTGNNIGAWFYGSKIKDTIPDTATIVSATINLPLFYNTGAAPVADLHGQASKPGGAVVPAGSTFALNPRTGKVAIPTTYIDALKAIDGGIALVNGGWAKYRGTQTDGLSGALEIVWLT